MLSCFRNNIHVVDYLEDYVSCDSSPQYAVLISGKWGVGKTFFIEKFIESYSLKDGGRKFIKISLNGINNIDSIDKCIFEKLYPFIFGNKCSKIIGKTAGVLLKYLNLDFGDIPIEDILDNKKDNIVYIFDDIERANIDIEEVLGYINIFVEQEGCKVVVIGNEDEVKDYDSYLREKEKIIGRTFKFIPEIDDVLEFFISSISNKKLEVLFNENKDNIKKIYIRSDLQNFRILKQCLLDFERLYKMLDDVYKSSKYAMCELMLMLFSVCFEIKSGRIKENDLRKCTFSYEKEYACSLDNVMDKYGEYYDHVKYEHILSRNVIADIVVNGNLNILEIQKNLDQMEVFQGINTASWLTVMKWRLISNKQFLKAFDIMEQEFVNRTFRLSGEIMHVFALRIFLARKNIILKNIEEVVTECKKYIDDVCVSSLKENELKMVEILDDCAYGLVFYNCNNQYWYFLLDYFNRKIRNLRKMILIKKVNICLLDGYEAFRQFMKKCEDDEFCKCVPILSRIDPEKFIDFWLSLNPYQNKELSFYLRSRYIRFKDMEFSYYLDNREKYFYSKKNLSENNWIYGLKNILIRRLKLNISPLEKMKIEFNVATIENLKKKKKRSREKTGK